MGTHPMVGTNQWQDSWASELRGPKVVQKDCYELGTVAHTCTSTGKAEAEGVGVQGHPCLHSKIEANPAT